MGSASAFNFVLSQTGKSDITINSIPATLFPSSTNTLLLCRTWTYVRYALEEGGLSTIGRPRSAKDYVPFLLGKGFKKVGSSTLDPIKGDIAVMNSFMGLNKNHPHGHIQMYNGKQWVSDFKQNAFCQEKIIEQSNQVTQF